MIERGFWTGRRVLVTGHTGFKGAWLCLWLSDMGAEVMGLGLGPPSEPSLYRLAHVDADVDSVEADVRDGTAVRRALTQHRPEIVIHMAAQSLVRRGLQDPVHTYDTNIMGTVQVLEAVRLDPGRVRAVLNVTSDKCYENRNWEWAYRENEPMGGRDPYSSSKGCSELVTTAYRASYFDETSGPQLATARAGNVIGGGDFSSDRLLPDIMRAALAGRTALVRNPAAYRPWQHVLNSLSGYLLLAQRLCDDERLAEGWNFGPSDRDAWPVRNVVERVALLWGGDLRWDVPVSDSSQEAAYLKIDSSRARILLGWRPAWELDEGLARTVEWYLALRDGGDVRQLALDQIHAFERTEAPRPALDEQQV